MPVAIVRPARAVEIEVTLIWVSLVLRSTRRGALARGRKLSMGAGRRRSIRTSAGNAKPRGRIGCRPLEPAAALAHFRGHVPIQFPRLARHHHPVRAQGRPGGRRRRRPGQPRPDRDQGQRRKVRRLGRRRRASPASPAPPPTPSPCSSGWRPSSSSIPGQLTRACVELAKDWRTDRYLRRLEAMMAVADREVSLVLTGTGDVLEPEDGLIGIGSGGSYALAAAARADRRRGPGRRGRSPARAMKIAADICVYTNENITLEILERAMTRTSRPREIVSELDRFIVGQHDAKRAVAIALRNRWRRQQLPRGAARGGAAQEHPDDRPDRRRQDRDRAPPRQARPGAVPQGRGDQVHRGRLCRPRRRADRPRPGRGRDHA